MSIFDRTPVKPIPDNAADATRWEYSAGVRRQLYGVWQDDVQQRLRDELGSTRAAVWSFVDTSHNVLLTIADTLSQSYVRPPIVSHPDGAEAFLGTNGLLAQSGWAEMMTRVERDLLALREMLINVSVAPDGRLVLRPISPDCIIATPDHNMPDRAVEVAELRLRHMPDGSQVWAYDMYSIADPSLPVYRIVGAGGEHKGKDLTAELAGTDPLIGEAYPWRNEDGDPVIPYAWYHGATTGTLWDAYAWSDLASGNLTIAVWQSMLSHVVRTSSWPQRVAVGLSPAGLSTSHDGRARDIITDPSTLLVMDVVDGFEGQPFLHQYDAGADPVAIQSVIDNYSRGLVAAAGVPASDVQRVSGDPRSGYALSITREGLREAQKRIQPQLMGDGHTGDTGLLALCAMLLNRHSESMGEPLNLPESGYVVEYQGVPQTIAEVQAQRSGVLELMAAGLLSRVDGYIELNPGTTKDEAAAALAAIDAEHSAAETVAVVPVDGEDDAEAEGTEAVEAAEVVAEDAAPDVLNGAQVVAAQGVVTSVAAGQLPRDTGVAMLVSFFGLSEQEADQIMGSVGRGFKPVPDSE